jgi:HEAT repeat protein
MAVVEKAGAGLQSMEFAGATEILRNEFQSEEGIQAVVAARMLYEEEQSERAAEFLIRALSSEDEKVASAARASVKKLGAEMVPYLVEAETSAAKDLVSGMRDEVVIPQLRATLDAKKAGSLLEALGYIADEKSVEVMKESFQNPKNESSWRLAAADAMARAARRNDAVEDEVVQVMENMLDNEGETDDRIKSAVSTIC